MPSAVWRSLPLLLGACGYQPLYGGQPAARLHVRMVRTLLPDAAASDEVASGIREELALEGALLPGDGWPRVEFEVLRAINSSEGVSDRLGAPFARGVGVGVVARAWIAAGPEQPPSQDTGDMQAEEVITVDQTAGALDPRATAFHTRDALRAAARRLGYRLARKLMGHPAVDEESDR